MAEAIEIIPRGLTKEALMGEASLAVRRRHVAVSPAADLAPSERNRPLPRALLAWQIRRLLEKLDQLPVHFS